MGELEMEQETETQEEQEKEEIQQPEMPVPDEQVNPCENCTMECSPECENFKGEEQEDDEEQEQEFVGTEGRPQAVVSPFELEISSYKIADLMRATQMVGSELTIELDDEGLNVSEMSYGQTAMVVAKLPKSAFKSYKIESPTIFTINRDIMSRVMRAFRWGSEELKLKSMENKLLISDGKRKYTLSFYERGRQLSKEPQPDYTYEIQMKTELKDKLREAGYISDSTSECVIFSCDGGVFDVSSETCGGAYHSSCEVGLIKNLKNEKQDAVKAQFQMEELKQMLSQGIEVLWLATNAPLKLTGSKSEIKLTYYLAPRTIEV